MTTSAEVLREEPGDPSDVRLAEHATGLLRLFNVAGVLAAADVHVAATLGRLGGEPDERVHLAAALAVRAARLGSVCLDLVEVRHTITVDGVDPAEIDALPWPAPGDWTGACAASPLVADGGDVVGGADRADSAEGAEADPSCPLRLVEGWLYLDRYWRQEELVRRELDSRAARPAPDVDPVRLRGALGRLFPKSGPQRQAAMVSAQRWVTVVAGGPGTGKTTTVARLLAVLADQPGAPLRVALGAPTGKAAARLREAVRAETAKLEPADRQRVGNPPAATLHRLLGFRPDARGRFRHDRHHRLPFDVVVVDETSMVSLTLMSRLLEAVRDDARLILVGDPDQLTSVEAGAVLGDVVARPAAAAGVVRLATTWRFGGAIAELAGAVRGGDGDAVLAVLRHSSPEVDFVERVVTAGAGLADGDGLRRDVVSAAAELTAAARAGHIDSALDLLDRHRLLCAHREGPYGVARWSEQVERWLSAAMEGYAAEGAWYRGRPLLVTVNDYDVRLFNGDTGVVVDGGQAGVQAAFGRGTERVLMHPSRLPSVQTVHAMTIHRSQGSQFERVSVLLPPAESPLLTRELFYTAITRATHFVRVLGTEDAVRAAVARPVVRGSGLRRG